MKTKINKIIFSFIFGVGFFLLLINSFSSSLIPQTSYAAANTDTIEPSAEIADQTESLPPISLEEVYQRVLTAGAYEFTADSEQTLLPRPLPDMIGQTDQRVDMYVSGEVTLPDFSRFSVSLDGIGLDPTPVAVVQEGANSYLLHEGEKIPLNNPVGLASPTGDFVSYLAAAENVAACETIGAPFANVAACYTFDLDGPRFAEHVRDLMQQQVNSTTDVTPPGALPQVIASPVLMAMNGNGKVWLDSNGLPVRQTIAMHLPELYDRYDADVRMIINYQFGPEAIAAVQAAQSNALDFLPKLPPVEEIIQTAQSTLPNLFILVFFVTIVAGLTILRRRRWIYSSIAIFLTISFLAAPLLQIIGYDLYTRRQVYAADFNTLFAENVQEAAAPETVAFTQTDDLAAPMQTFAPDVYCGLGGNGDRDGDKLADDAENCLGTDPNVADSDYDGVDDGREVFGFEYGQTVTQTWYSDPLNPDSNGDGRLDGSEWPSETFTGDLDNDGLPDLWDNDDDGDDVSDGNDLSPASRTDYITPTATTTISSSATTTDTFNFNISGAYNGYVYLDIQIQPQNLDHIRFGMTPLDWGADFKGQIQDHNNSTDDIQLIPMLSLEANLPPDRDLAEEYNVSPFNDTDNDGYSNVLIPLSPVGTAGSYEAFNAKIAYGPETLADLGESGIRWRNAQLVWIVQAKLDSESGDQTIEKSTPIHTYVEPSFRVTGWQVTKSGAFESAILGTPEMPNDDRQLFQLLFGLSDAFLTHQNPDLDEIVARFSGANTPAEQKWGVTTTVAIDLPVTPYTHFNAGVKDLDTRIKSFLGDNYPWDSTNVFILASESHMGLYGQDNLGKFEPALGTLAVNLNNIPLVTQRSLDLQMRDGWKIVTDSDLALQVLDRAKGAVNTAVPQLQDQYPDVNAADLMALVQSFYVTWEGGRIIQVQADGVNSEAAATTDQEIYERLYTTPRDRHNDPENISTLPGYLVEVGSFAQKGGGLVFAGGPAQVQQYLRSNTKEARVMGFTTATPNFIDQASDAISFGMGDDIQFTEDETDWNKLREAASHVFFGAVAYNASKNMVLNVAGTSDAIFDAVNGATKVSKVGVALLILDIGLTLLAFGLSGDFSGQAIAMLIATIIVSIALFALSLVPVVGWIIVAIIGLVDFIFTLVFDDFTLTGWAAKQLAGYLYKEEPLTEIGDFDLLGRDMTVLDESLGYSVGNRLRISDTFEGTIEVVGAKSLFDFDSDRAQSYGAAALVPGGLALKVMDDIDILGTLMGMPSNAENLRKSWICGEFIIEGWSATNTTCPFPNIDYNLDTISKNAPFWTYTNPMTSTLRFMQAGANLEIPVDIKVTAQTRWDASAPIPFIGRYHWQKERKITLPDDLPDEDQEDWQPTSIYIDILPASVEELWYWNDEILINHDPDGDGLTTKTEITNWMGSKGYSDMQNFFDDYVDIETSADLEKFLSFWDLYEKFGLDWLVGIDAFCTAYPARASLCDDDSSPPWLTWDYDNDGLSDKFEFDNSGALGTNYMAADTDGDGLSDGFEYQIGTQINAKDSDGDGLTDDIEVYHPTSGGIWAGGWEIDLPEYGAVGPNGRTWFQARVFSNPLVKDTDGDGMSDMAEKENGTSPTAYNRAPRVEVTGQPTAVSPQGVTAIYVKPGDPITLTSRLEVYPPYTVSTAMELDIPYNAYSFPDTSALNGSRWVDNTGVTFTPRWNFSNNVLQPWEYLHAQTTGYVPGVPSSNISATVSLPFGGEDQLQEDSQLIVVDSEDPRFSWLTPAHGELLGGGVSSYVIGGTSGDQTTWVNKITLELPDIGVQSITDTETFSPWAYTWELPSDGIYTLYGNASDFVGHTSISDDVRVMIDNTAPSTDVNLVDGAVFGKPENSDVITITLAGTASENLSGLTRVQISTDGGPWREVWTLGTADESNTTFVDNDSLFPHRALDATWDAVWTLPNVETVQGYHNLRIRAFDKAGNWPTYLERNIIIDVIPPTDDLLNQAYLYEYPHVVANETHTFQGVTNDVGNVPQPSRPVELVGDLDSINDATIWLGLDDIGQNDGGVNAAWIGDFNGDRRGDLLVGLPAADDGAGRVAVIYGRSGNWPVPDDQEMLANAKTSFVGLPGAGIGEHARPAGDVNGDGMADLLIGDPANNRVYLIFGQNKYLGSDLLLDGPQTGIRTSFFVPDGQLIGDNIGAAGDVNGDGLADFFIGATGSVDYAYLILGQGAGWNDNIAADRFAAAKISGAGAGTLSGIGDVDGDFYDEFAVGLNNTLYLFAGRGSFAPQAGAWYSLTSGPFTTFASNNAAPETAALGDVNGDHIDDFIYTSGTSQVLVLGDDTRDASWNTQTYGYGTGFLAAPGDVDNDGLNDILIGGNDTAYLVLGSDLGDAEATIAGVANAASAPYAAGADLNSDGSSDLLLVPTATSTQATAAAETGFADLPPTWVPQMPEANLETFVGSTTWPAVSGNAYVSGNGDCHGMFPCYSTIQTAVDSLGGHDLIIVQPGVYAPFSIDGNQTFHDYLQIRGTDTDAVIIDGSDSSYGVLISNVDGIKIENLTVRNASYGVQLDNAGVNGHDETFRRIILDHLLIYDTGSHDIYMSRNSTASVLNSTLSRSSNHVGAYGAADPNIVVEWSNANSTYWPITDGGGAVLVDNVIYVNRGGGSNEFDRFFVNTGGWSHPWGPTNAYEANSTIAAGSDDQVYLLGAPHWRNSTLPAWYDGNFTAGGNGVMYAEANYLAYYWDGNDWVQIPGSPENVYMMAAHPVNGDLYVFDYILDEVLKWDGSSWTSMIGTGFYFSDAGEMEIGSDGTIYFAGEFTSVFRGEYNPTCSGQVVYANSANSSTFNCYDYGEDAVVNALAADPDSNAVYVGGEFETDWGDYNLTTINGGSINGVSGPVDTLDFDDEGTIYVGGEFTSTLSYDGSIDQQTPASIASWDGSNWTAYPTVIEGDEWINEYAYDIAVTGGGEFYAYGSWDDFPGDTSYRFVHWDGSGWEVGNIYNESNNPAIWSMASSAQGVFISGHITSIEVGAESVSTAGDLERTVILQSPFEVYSTTLNSWHTGLAGPPVRLGDGASMAGDDYGNLVVLVGGGRTDSFKYDIETGEWSRVDGMTAPVNASAMTKGEDGYVYAVTDGPDSLYRFTGYWWEDVGPAMSGVTLDDGVTMAYDSHFGTYYVLPGGNGTAMLRYNPAWGSSWETLPVERNTPAGVRPGAGLIFVEGEDENKLYTAQGNYIGGTSTAFWMYPLPMPNKIDFTDSIIYSQNSTNWLNFSDPLPEDFNFRVDENSRFFGGNGWAPTNMGTLPTTTDDPFLDAARDVYRISETGATYTIGYHIYTEPVTATTTTGIQAMINTGANRVIVQPGIYEEDVYLVNGVELIGTNPDWTVIKPLSGSTADALVRAMGSNGASFSRFTLDGENSGLNGFAATGNAANLTVQRVRIYDTDTGITLDGPDSDVEVVHATVANNNNGLVATNCASIDVRNSIFAYHNVSGLSHEACAAVQLHTYNLFWANGNDFGGSADAGAAELFLDPNFVDPMDNDYRTLNFSPVIDTGNPTDPSPPGAGSRADIGYIEQGRVNFYVDDSYCEICLNDGLTWQVDAFDNIQDALDAAENALSNLNPTYVDVPQLVVGVAPGTYNEQVTIPSHVLLIGSSAENTMIDGQGGTAVSFDAVTDSAIRNLTVMNADTAVSISNASNNINIARNIIRNNTVGISLSSRATADVEYNTLVSNGTGIQADGSGSWAALMHNIISGSGTGLLATNNGQIFSEYNLYFNTVDFSGVSQGEYDLVGQAPLFAGGEHPYRLSATSPALDAASPFAIVPNGGGVYADLGYSELLAAPVTLLLGQEDLSTVMGNSGVATVEYGVVAVADPTTPFTETVPATWEPIVLDSPGETYSYWKTDYLPVDEGLYRFYSRATDMVGNTEEDELDWYDGSFVVDSTPPTVEWLTPLDGASLEVPLELRAQVTDYAAGEFSVEEKDVYFEIDGQRYPATWAAEPWDASNGEARVFRAWISPTVGLHSNAIAGAEDKAGNTAQANNVSFTVTGVSPLDTTPPIITPTLPVDGSWVTHTVTFSGTVTDLGSGIASVEVSVDGGATWRPATVNGNDWSLTWDGPENQSLVSYPAALRATDSAGNSSSTTLQFTIDELAPSGLTPVTFDAPEGSHFDKATDLEITWQPAIDASGIVTTFLTMDQITDTLPWDGVNGTTAVFNLNSNGDWYAHLMAIDAAGNATLHHFGPWHVGLNDGVPFAQQQQTILIDGLVDVAHNEWRLDTEYLDDDERTIGSEVTYSPDGQQAFLTAWDANNYFMAWRGGWWSLDGDLWIYLKAGGSGSNELIVPLASAPDATLPFAADYAIQITDPISGTLYEYSGGWQVSAAEWAFANGGTGDTEIRLPLFGTSNVEIIAFGLGDDQNVWSIFPATNPLNPGTTTAGRPTGLAAPTAEGDGWNTYHWDDVTAVTNVADNQPIAVALELELESSQAASNPWGPGSTLEYIITINNLEDEIVSGQPLSLSASAADTLIHDSIEGASCTSTNPWDCTLDPLAPGLNVITLTTHLANDLSGLEAVMMVATLSGSNIPPELNTQDSVRHQLDGMPPEVELHTAPFVGLGSYSFEGSASDGDGAGVAYVEVRPQSGGWQRAEGTTLWTVDLTVSPFAEHGDSWQFEVRAVDLYGQVSDVVTAVFTVDLEGPDVTFDSPTQLSGNLNEIMGSIMDVPEGSKADTVMVQLDDEQWREATIFALDETSGSQPFMWIWNMPTEDGVTHTLRVQTTDQVGNEGSLSPEQTVWVDNVAPAITVTEVLTEVAVQHYFPGAPVGGPVLAGTSTDGTEVNSVAVWIELPDGTSRVDTAVLNADTGAWQYVPALQTLGFYKLQVRSFDSLGNQNQTEFYELEVKAAPESGPNSFFTPEDTPLTFEPLLDDIDIDSDSITLDAVADPDNGTATIHGDTQIIYTPTLNFNGTEVFTYTATDGQFYDSATVTVTVLAVNDPPQISGPATLTDTMAEDGTPLIFNLNGVNVDDDTFSWEIIGGTGTAEVSNTSGTGNLNAEVTYTPPADFNGSDSFQVQVSDGVYNDSVTVEITVNPVDDAPRAADDYLVLVPDDAALPHLMDVLANDDEVDGQTLQLDGVGTPSNGGTAVAIVNQLHYTTNLTEGESETVSYTVSDGVLTDTATLHVNMVAGTASGDAGDTIVATGIGISDTVDVSLTIPPNLGSDDEKVTIVLRETTLANDAPPSYKFAGLSFVLDVYVDGVLTPDFVLNSPISIEISYSDADVAHIGRGDAELMLLGWNGSEWLPDGITLGELDSENNQITLTVDTLTDFALFGKDMISVYLPMVVKP